MAAKTRAPAPRAMPRKPRAKRAAKAAHAKPAAHNAAPKHPAKPAPKKRSAKAAPRTHHKAVPHHAKPAARRALHAAKRAAHRARRSPHKAVRKRPAKLAHTVKRPPHGPPKHPWPLPHPQLPIPPAEPAAPEPPKPEPPKPVKLRPIPRPAGPFFVTTPIFYINDNPHIGHAYTAIAADTIARWHRAAGREVFFLTGTDENSAKTVQAARAASEPVPAYTDRMAAQWRSTWDALGITYDSFIRTTEPRHHKTVLDFFSAVSKDKDAVYEGVYEGWYCDGCEAFYTERDLDNGSCKLHKKPARRLKEENRFFRLSKYAPKVEAFLKANPSFVQPAARRNEVLSFLREGAKDISITRPNLVWGIPFPEDPHHRFWVWFDALLNYISGAPDRWPAQLHLVGKDIIRFHCVIWPAMLIAAGRPLPAQVFAHGFFTVEGQKMSKSLGNAIDPLALAKKYGRDSLRYYFLREIPFGEDGDFSERALVARHNNELLAELGNLVSRVLTLAENEPVAGTNRFLPSFEAAWEKVEAAMSALQFHVALETLFGFVREVNKYLTVEEPWKKAGPARAEALGNALQAIAAIAIGLQPFLPDTAASIFSQLRSEPLPFYAWRSFEPRKPKKSGLLFQKVPEPGAKPAGGAEAAKKQQSPSEKPAKKAQKPPQEPAAPETSDDLPWPPKPTSKGPTS